MTQEDKKLLLNDLCARLPHGVKFQSENIETVLFVDTSDNEVWINGTCIDDFKPYLFPLSSMTEEQKEEYCQLQQKVIYNSKGVVNEDITKYINWCYKKHLDINDLIPKELAIDATGLNIY